MNQNNQNSQNSQSTQNDQGQKITFLPQHGHYRHLRVYQVTEMIYDITFYFTQHYLQKGDRTIDQMVQAARSGKQNIAEGNQDRFVKEGGIKERMFQSRINYRNGLNHQNLPNQQPPQNIQNHPNTPNTQNPC